GQHNGIVALRLSGQSCLHFHRWPFTAKERGSQQHHDVSSAEKSFADLVGNAIAPMDLCFVNPKADVLRFQTADKRIDESRLVIGRVTDENVLSIQLSDSALYHV